MKANTFIPILLFISQFGFSQTEKPVKGKVLCNDLPIQGIEVLNLVTEKTTITNEKGEFTILGKAEDMLVFVSEKYDYKRLLLEKEDINKPDLVIKLTRKPEQLEEVVITKVDLGHVGYFSQEVADEIKLEKGKYRNREIYDGTIENGVDFIRIGKMILGLIVKKKENNKEIVPKIEFKELATATCTQDYFNKTLQLKPEEIALFLEFCDADTKSKIILEEKNPLSLMDFLFVKNVEFKKLTRIENK
ncbi:hypothetical protein SAMN05443549_104197 [Flavobacterium fluvii]|uniref:CarboxypepD_reg-like domain-containing protein n=1 Tax=Flavobacterium fluvii TaxID=468056 RepID=A0A1M5K6T8_9FLAO|nr:hypothetical protein [Flavobacterium fluvii]SHG48300.1 hypothetical protein SAMN05443549_104197 [Flavobacterium fluvii]